MHTNSAMTTTRASVGIIAIALVAAIAMMLAASPGKALSQQANTPILGYAWSETIGWVDLNCANNAVPNQCATSNFGLSIDASGNISGYAWSDNIGWVSANTGDTAVCGSQAKISGTSASGWLRAISGTGNNPQAGGWDGCISLSGSNPNYGITYTNNQFSGYAWGDMNVGWVDFSNAFTSCVPTYLCTPGNTGVKNSCTGVVTPCAAGDTCNPSTNKCETQCTYSCQGNQITSSCPGYPVTCSGGTPFCQAGSPICHVNPPPPLPPHAAVHLTVSPALVRKGSTTHISWDIQNVRSCSVTGTNGVDSWSDSNPVGSESSRNVISSGLIQQTIYTLNCTGLDNSTYTESATVNIVPIFKEI